MFAPPCIVHHFFTHITYICNLSSVSYLGQRHSGRRHFPDADEPSVVADGQGPAAISLNRTKTTSAAAPQAVAAPSSAAGPAASASVGVAAAHTLHAPAPTIDRKLTPANVTGQLGATVYLHCYVHNIGQKTVSSTLSD